VRQIRLEELASAGSFMTIERRRSVVDSGVERLARGASSARFAVRRER
jgi:hypothetical protein